MISAASFGDWQFVAVTLAALGGAWVLLRPLWTGRKARKAAGGCGKCASAHCGKAPGPAGPRLVTLGRGSRTG